MEQIPGKISDLIRRIEGEQHMSSQKLNRFINEYQIETSDISEYAMYEHAPEDSYGRKTVWASDRFGIHVMTWNLGDYTALHSHGHAEWASMLFLGDASQRIYSVHGNHVELKEVQEIPAGTCFSPGISELYHAMGNSGTESFLTMHIYGSDSYTGTATDDAVVYEIEKERMLLSTGPAFINMSEAQCKRILDGKLVCDQSTRQDYIECIRPFYTRIGQEKVLSL